MTAVTHPRPVEISAIGLRGLRAGAGRAFPALRLAAWFYLAVVSSLALWLLAARLTVGWTPVVVTSGSMGPSVRPGDVVMTSEPPAHVAAGTVVVFEDPAAPGRRITHRVISDGPEPHTYVTKGDGNADADSTPLAHSKIEGVGRLLVPSVGLPLLWLEGGAGSAFALWCAATAAALALVAVPVRRPHRNEP